MRGGAAACCGAAASQRGATGGEPDCAHVSTCRGNGCFLPGAASNSGVDSAARTNTCDGPPEGGPRLVRPAARPGRAGGAPGGARRWAVRWRGAAAVAAVLWSCLLIAGSADARPWLLWGARGGGGGGGGGGGRRSLLEDAAAALAAGLPGLFGSKHTDVFPQQWEAYNSDLARVRVDAPSAGRRAAPRRLPPHVGALLPSSELLNPAQMARSLAYAGGGHRLRRVLRDLAAASAAGISGGGSGGGGGGLGAPAAWTAAARPVKIAVLGGSISWGSAVTGGVDDWFTLVTNRLKEVFPGAAIEGRNGCVPATPSSFMNMCLEHYLDEEVDLVFLEYATNDGWDINDDGKKHTYERLLRKVLNKPRAPAVVLVQLPTVGQAFGEGNPKRGGFARTVEDVYGAFAAYYDTPYLSFRNAVWRLARLHHYGMNFTDWWGYNYDFIHPLVPGHRAIADMVLYALQRFSLGLELSPWSNADAAEAALPIPPPMFEGNFEERNRLCRNGEALESAVVSREGWDLVNEGNSLKQKWGFVARAPGAELVIEVNTSRITRPEEPRISVQVAYLRSYAGMGRAEVACGNGCECGRTEVDAHHGLHQSTIYLLRLRPTQAPRCRVRIKVLKGTSSPDAGHKFKVTGVMANEYVGNGTDVVDGVLNNEEWLGIINKAVNATIINDKGTPPPPRSSPTRAPPAAEADTAAPWQGDYDAEGDEQGARDGQGRRDGGGKRQQQQQQQQQLQVQPPQKQQEEQQPQLQPQPQPQQLQQQQQQQQQERQRHPVHYRPHHHFKTSDAKGPQLPNGGAGDEAVPARRQHRTGADDA